MDSFAALAEPNRRRIVEMLATNGRLSVGEINDRFSITPPAVSQHLKVLREADLVRIKKLAQQRIYSLNLEGIDEVWEWLGRMRRFWNERFEVMDALLLKEHNQSKESKHDEKRTGNIIP
jgi:DNA-binding transcriptional ArsR family regulator